jgi:hypothetical protein
MAAQSFLLIIIAGRFPSAADFRLTQRAHAQFYASARPLKVLFTNATYL